MSADVITRTADASRGQARRGYPNRRARGSNNNPHHPQAPPTHRGPNNRNNRAKEKNVDTTNPNNREPAEQESTTTIIAAPPQKSEETTTTTTTSADSDNIIVAAPKSETAADVCWICAEPVKYYSLSECNHRTCHVCAIRLRALYKKTDCTFCKVPQTVVIFTVSPDALFSSYTLDAMQFKDPKLSVYFETQEMMEDTLILLRFNCPDSECAYIGNGWSDLRLHVRATHGKLMCDLCIRHKKVFSHEHALYPPLLLPVHLPLSIRSSKATVKEPIEGGIHPRCGFCRDCFFGDDELYSHMRERHEECFICKRNGIRDQHFENYESLERHFYNAHHPCIHADCLARKFVVFDTALDLKAHTVEDHGGDMSSRDKKDARRVQADFAFEDVGGRHGHGHGRRDRERDREQQRERDRDPPPPPPPRQQQAQSSAATVPPPGSGARRREAFGGGLTQTGDLENNNRGISRPSTPQTTTEVDQAVIERHARFLTRLQSLTSNPNTAVPVIKAATRGYRLAETTARDLILTIWNVVDQKLEHTASIVNAFVDLVDEEEKKQDILTSWKSFEIEQRRQFPELVPSSFGSGYAGITSGRVLNAKHSSAARSSSQSSQQQVWNRVALAAESSSSSSTTTTTTLPSTSRPFLQSAADRFPALGGSGSGTNNNSSTSSLSSFPTAAASGGGGGGFRQAQRGTTPWSASSRPSSSTSKNATTKTPPKLSSTLFPELPSLMASRTKPQVSGNVSLKNILGSTTGPVVSAWKQQSNNNNNNNMGDGGNNNNNTTIVEEQGEVVGEGPIVSGDATTSGAAATATTTTTQTKGRKEKGKQKQTLFTIGSLVT